MQVLSGLASLYEVDMLIYRNGYVLDLVLFFFLIKFGSFKDPYLDPLGYMSFNN